MAPTDPERAVDADRPADPFAPADGSTSVERLTVVGVEPTDSRLAAELWRFVPREADALYAPTFAGPSAAALALASLRNPPVALYLALALAIRRVRHGAPLPVTEAVESAAERRGLEQVPIDDAPLDRLREQGSLWTVAAWVVTAFVALALGLLALSVGGEAVAAPVAEAVPVGLRDDVLALGGRERALAYAVAAVCPPLVAGFVLAHAGADVERRDERIASAVLASASSAGHDHPVVVVDERHLPGVAECAKDRRVPANAVDASATLAAEPAGVVTGTRGRR